MKQWIDHCFVDFHCCEASWVHFFAQLSLSAFFKFTPSRQTNFSFFFLLELLNINRNDWKLQTDTSVYKYVDKKNILFTFSNSQPPSPSCTPNCRVPRPSPVSPTGLTEYQKRMLWKKNVKPASAPYDDNRHNQGVCKSHASIVGIHELYENDELSQDWKDVYITSAYLVWCQPNRVG